MATELQQYDVTVIGLSKDTVADAARQKKQDKLTLTLLSDRGLEVIKQYGLEHHKAVEFSTGRFSVFGIPLALVPSIKTMAMPTSILIDEHGVVRWIDQAEDYRLRSNEARVMEAIKGAFAASGLVQPELAG